MDCGVRVTEQLLFDFIKEVYVPDLIKTDQFEKWDCVSQINQMYIELKCRATHYPDLVIEESKYRAVRRVADSINYIPWYINSTPKGIWAFNLYTVREPIWQTVNMPINTEFDNNRKIPKLVGFLRIEEGAQL